MFVTIHRAAAVSTALGLLYLSACSPRQQTGSARTPEFYWSAAGESWAARDYVKAADHLEHLIEPGNTYAARAIPWHLVVTSGTARGYMDLADRYELGARINKANALKFRREAAKYRTVAAKLALRFAQDVDRFHDVPLGKLPLSFSFPAGNAAEPPLFSRIGSGLELTAAERDAAEAVAVQRGVLFLVCAAVGAPNDVAKGREALGSATGTPRETFGKAIADTLKAESALFARDKLDEPQRIEAFQKRAELALAEGARVGNARIGLLVSASPDKQ